MVLACRSLRRQVLRLCGILDGSWNEKGLQGDIEEAKRVSCVRHGGHWWAPLISGNEHTLRHHVPNKDPGEDTRALY